VSLDATTSRITSSIVRQGAPHPFRPWRRWLLTALAFPPAGFLAHAVAGRVDSVSAAVLGGAIAGAGIGAAQWALLRRRGIGVVWIVATAAGLGAGLASGAAAVDYRTDISSLLVMGAITGLAVGLAQGAALRDLSRALLWCGATAALWTAGWAVTTAWGIDVEEQWVVFGISGALTLAFLQSVIVGVFVPDSPGLAEASTQKVTS
jgi:hypothetical protein